MPLRVQIFHTRRPYFGAHSGIQQFVSYLDPARIRSRVRTVTDGDDDLSSFPFRYERARGLVRRLVQRRGQNWYNLSDFAAETAVLPRMLAGRFDVLHFIDGEQTAQFLPLFARRLRICGRTVATYHQSPAVLPKVVVPAVVRNLDHVTLVSSSQLEWFDRVLPRERLTVILHGIDVTFFAPDTARRAADVFRCITTGSYLRDWPLLSDIARLLLPRQEIELHVVSGSAPAFESLPNVKVHRGIGDEALRELYQAVGSAPPSARRCDGEQRPARGNGVCPPRRRQRPALASRVRTGRCGDFPVSRCGSVRRSDCPVGG